MSNRIIKFRAWDAETQSMYPHEILVNDQWKVEEICNPMGDISVMQFTGLKDKHGKEVYEGDALTNHEGSDYKQGSYLIVSWNNKDGCWDSADKLLGRASKDYIIIGNIFENPELLK